MTNSAELLPCETPLVELLENVPADARMTYEHSPTHHQMIPVGRLCREAAAKLRAESRPSLQGDVVELLGDPNEWANKKDELLMWTGSAFLAGETHSSDGDLKGDLYSFLCGLIGWLTTGELAARAALLAEVGK